MQNPKLAKPQRQGRSDYQPTSAPKSCTRCKEVKAATEFYPCPRVKSGLSSTCIVCTKEVCALHRNRPETKMRSRELNRAWRTNNPDKVQVIKERAKSKNKVSNRARQYGISTEKMYTMYAAQRGACAICKTEKPLIDCHRQILYVDHDHTTGKVRGLLCKECNCMLGFAKDNRLTLRRAIAYLMLAENGTI